MPEAPTTSKNPDEGYRRTSSNVDFVIPNASNKPGNLQPGSTQQKLSTSEHEQARLVRSSRCKMMALGTPREGDTQPFSQSVYEEFKNGQTSRSQHQDTNCATPNTYSHGRSNHIDLVGLFDKVRPEDDVRMLDDTDGIGEGSQVDVHADMYPEPNRFKQPKTPGTSGRKGAKNGDLVNHDLTTPRLPVNPFAVNLGKDVGVMNLTQVFKATQAPSSPTTNMLPSDAISDRPSPDMYNLQRLSTAQSLSSPAKIRYSGLQRAITEPYANYVSMQQSQDERERRLRMQHTSSPADLRTQISDILDDEFQSEGSQLRRRRNQKRIEAKTRNQFDRVTAPPRPGSSGSAKRHGDYQTHRHETRSSPIRGRATRATVVISDDPLGDEPDANVTEDETEHEEDIRTPGLEEPDELGDDNKENVGASSVRILKTSPRSIRKTPVSERLLSSPLRRKRHDSPENLDIDELADTTPIRLNKTASFRRVKNDIDGVEAVTIVDSQNSQPEKSYHGPQGLKNVAHPESRSSGESRTFVPQSQIPDLPRTSQIDSSMARRIVDASSYINGNFQVSSQSLSSQELLKCSSPAPTRGLQSRPPRSANSGPDNQDLCSDNIASSPPQRAEEEVVDAVTFKNVIDLNGTDLVSDSKADPLPPYGLRTKTLSTDTTTNVADTDSRSDVLNTNIETPHQGTIALRSTIPETSSASRYTGPPGSFQQYAHTTKLDVARSHPDASSPTAAPRAKPSFASSTFDTARTHITEVTPKPAALRVRYSSEPCESPSRRNVVRPKAFMEITADPSPPDDIGEVDVDIGLMTYDDINFKEVMEGSSPVGPTKKRRRGRNGRTLPIQDPEPGPALATSSPSSSRELPQARINVTEVNAIVSLPPASSATPRETCKTTEARQARKRPTAPCSPLVGFGNVPPPSSTASSGRSNRIFQRLQTSKARQHRQIILSSEINSENNDENALTREEVVKPQNTRAGTPTMARCDHKLISPNRVFAVFKGTPPGYYPATCIGSTGEEEPRYKVRFDDGTVSVVNAPFVKRLELREGDHIKIDQPGYRKSTYVVCGLKDKQPFQNDSPSKSQQHRGGDIKLPATDVFGHLNVRVCLKPHLATPEGSRTSQEETIPLANVYLSSTVWKTFKDRGYSYHSPLPAAVSGLQTPSERPSSPSTPSSRTRRAKTSGKSHMTISMPTSVVRYGSGLFENMVFGITNVEDQGTREQLLEHITSNGGLLLDLGFDELFQIPDISTDETLVHEGTENGDSFQLKLAASRRGFTCLIADKHSRNQKFFQALALGIPCLATRWVSDCVTKQRILPWEPYMLPSGESTFLNAVRTRLLPSCSPETALLPETISHRPNFLAGSSVLLIVGKGREQTMKAYPFIAYALGARKVARAVSLEAARLMLRDGMADGREWDWVCFHEGEMQMTQKQVEKVLLGGGSAGKRKRRVSEVVRRSRTRVVATEFVIQSLILGQLLDEE